MIFGVDCRHISHNYFLRKGLEDEVKYLNYSMESRGACKSYLINKLNYVPVLIYGIKGNLLTHRTATIALALSPTLSNSHVGQ
jgi:hypothetical protein